MTTDGSYEVTVTDSNGCQGSDQIFVSFIVTTGDPIATPSLTLFPNPTHEKITLSLINYSGTKASVQLISLDGKIILSNIIRANASGMTETINMSDYAAGVYYLRIQTEGWSRVEKIVKE
ncbi:MAG: T9SS type A sorting domain-containing protein [Bacteroidetes bacterium]|nr:T9SS type A sorting domain-containing protein [Bacteroidota bacterium]